MNIAPGETVAVQSLGGLGHLALQSAPKMGYRVVALASSASKEKFGRDFGAVEYVDDNKEDHGEVLQKLGSTTLIVINTPTPELIEPFINGLGIQGKILILARKFSSYKSHSTLLIERYSLW